MMDINGKGVKVDFFPTKLMAAVRDTMTCEALSGEEAVGRV